MGTGVPQGGVLVQVMANWCSTRGGAGVVDGDVMCHKVGSSCITL